MMHRLTCKRIRCQTTHHCPAALPALPCPVLPFPHLSPHPSSICASLQTPHFQVFVRHSHTFTVNGLHAVDDVDVLREAIERKTGVPCAASWLSHRGRQLDGGRPISSYNICSGETVHLAVRGRGGGCFTSKEQPQESLGTGIASGRDRESTGRLEPEHRTASRTAGVTSPTQELAQTLASGHFMYTIRGQENLSTDRTSSADARWDGAGFDKWATDHAVWTRVRVLRELDAGSRCIRTASDLRPEQDYIIGPSPDSKLHLYAVCDFSVMLTECPSDMSLGAEEDSRRLALQTLVAS